jgi:uncharacterized membrane protein YbhN (UPF0104 family)
VARTALTGGAFGISFGFASGDLLFDLLSLDLVFLALRYQPGFRPLAVAYRAANIASTIAHTRLRLRPDADGKKKPATPEAGRPHSEH